MGSVSGPYISTPIARGLGNQALLDKIDRLRELHVGGLVSLPQLVAVGDQSSGKSSVLESLTGFAFPRAAGLCTRYATQITCCRESLHSVTVSIIPRPGADDAANARLRKFRRSVDAVSSAGLVDIFEEANRAMGIRPPDGAPDAGLITFSEDILKIEINGPDQPALTLIDVPGIFRNSTPGLTTESDMALVTSMVKSYIKDPRTIILAVIPCNVDIATQDILKLAKDADPSGSRTMGVLTKPDLAPERAVQQNILDLIQGKRQDLKLGYCVVKNRGADDEGSTLQKRNDEEAAFFRQVPWSTITSSNRVGIEALKVRLRDLLMNISKKEFPTLKAEISRKLVDCRKRLEGMGAARSDEKSQRAYLGNIATRFQSITNLALNAYYTEDAIFTARQEMRLITRILELNDVFVETFSQRGHTRQFDHDIDDEEEQKPKELPRIDFEIPSVLPELADIIATDRFECPLPSCESLMDRIEKDFKQSRGPELGTFGTYLLSIIFKEQSKHWEDIVLSHVSDAVVLVHQFILDLLDYVFADAQVRNELYDNVLLEKLQAAYEQSMGHARFLLNIEREGKPATYHPYFNTELQEAQMARLEKSLDKMAVSSKDGARFVSMEAIKAGGLSLDKSSTAQVRELLHDILKSYYDVASKRFVDVLCQQVIDHFLLNSKNSPLHVFSTELVFDLDAGALEMIAGEDQVTKQERERLGREIESLQEAMKVLRS